MITRNDLNKALNEINDSYAGLLKKLSELEAKEKAKEKKPKKKRGGERGKKKKKKTPKNQKK
jgi:hypothetical protein